MCQPRPRPCRRLCRDPACHATHAPAARPRRWRCATGAARVFVKAENLQWAGSFKLRGAIWRLTCLDAAAERNAGSSPILAAISRKVWRGGPRSGRAGDHRHALRRARDQTPRHRRLWRAGGPVGPRRPPPRRGGLGPGARDLRDVRGWCFCIRSTIPMIVAGQAGAGLEALEQMAEAGAAPDLVVCPVGGGGLDGRAGAGDARRQPRRHHLRGRA